MKDKIINALKWFLNSYIWLGLLFLIADIVSKNLIVQNQNNIGDGVDIIPGFIRVRYIINKNIVFGWDVFKNATANRIVFIIVALLVAIGIIIFLIKKWDKINRFYKACLMMIIAGAIGNCIDRIFFTAEYLSYIDPETGKYITGVVDWIDIYCFSWWKFNFNIADTAVVIAAIMLIVYMIVVDIIEYHKKSNSEPKKVVDNTKVISKTEQEKNQYLEENKPSDE